MYGGFTCNLKLCILYRSLHFFSLKNMKGQFNKKKSKLQLFFNTKSIDRKRGGGREIQREREG